MKKTLLITLDFPPNIGGVANYYANLCSHLPPEDIAVLAPQARSSAKFDEEQDYSIYREKMLSTHPLVWPKWTRLIPIVKKLIDNEGFEMILVGNVLPVGTVAYHIQKSREIPYSVFTHGMDITTPIGKRKFLMKKILERAKKIYVNSSFLRHELVGLGVHPQRTAVIYPCSNLPETADHEEVVDLQKVHDLEDKKVLLTVGRIVQRKGHDMVIRSLKAVQKKVPNVVYVIVGEGPYKPQLEKLIHQHGVSDIVKFVGSVDQDTLCAFYELSDVFIMTPYMLKNRDVEGFGIVYLEAAQFGKPVIATKTGGVSEAVLDEKTGLVVPPRKRDEIIDAIITLLTDESKAHKLGTQALDRVYHEFRWELQAEALKKTLM